MAPFLTAAEKMAVMPELRLSSPHPASKTTNARASSSSLSLPPFQYQQTNAGRAASWPGDDKNDARSDD